MPLNDDRVLVVLQDPGRTQSHPFVWLGIGTGLVVGLLYFLRGRSGSGGGSDFGSGLLGDRAPKRDDTRLAFVMTAPTDVPSQPLGFRGPDGTAYSLDDLVARVKSGGRTDVALKATGSVRQGAWDSAKALIKAAGLEVWEASSGPSGKTVGSSARGVYR